MRYEHILTFDQEEHEKTFLYDNKAEKSGLSTACCLINGEISKLLKGTLLNGVTQADQKLAEYYQKRAENHPDDAFFNVVKGVSEAVFFATAACF